MNGEVEGWAGAEVDSDEYHHHHRVFFFPFFFEMFLTKISHSFLIFLKFFILKNFKSRFNWFFRLFF